MNRPRLAIAVLATAMLAACGAGPSNQALPVVSAVPAPVPPASATVAVGTTPASQALSLANGGTAQVSLTAAAGTPANASVAMTTSATAPSGATAIAAAARVVQAITRVPLSYVAFVANVDVQLATYPAFTFTFPSSILPTGTLIHEAFADTTVQPPAYSYDIASGINGATLTATAKAPKLVAGKTYVFAFYYETGSAATPSPAPSASPSPVASATPVASPTPVASSAPSASPTPVASPTGFVGGSATFSAPTGGYNGLVTAISPLSTTEGGGMGNVSFFSIPPGQTGNGIDGAHPNRSITLEINDNTPITNSSTYVSADFTTTKVLLTYGEQFGAGGFGFGRYWIANGGSITFENVANGAATYRLRGATFIPDKGFVSNQAVGSFTLDAVVTGNPFTQ